MRSCRLSMGIGLNSIRIYTVSPDGSRIGIYKVRSREGVVRGEEQGVVRRREEG